MKKNKRLFEAISFADDKYISEADPRAVEQRKKKKIYVWGSVAACFACAFIALNLWLFIPFKNELPDVSQYKDREYYDIIVKLNVITHRPPRYKNNFDKFIINGIGNIFGATKEDNTMGGAEMAPTSSPSFGFTSDDSMEDGTEYEEVTDNQVAGIIEADRIKRSSTHVYYLDGETLKIYSINGYSSEMVGKFTVENSEYTERYSYHWEFYLSNDCNTVTVIAPGYTKNGESAIDVISIDVSDPTNVKQTERVTFTGSYLSSRLVDGKLLLLTNFYVKYNPDFSNEAEFVPQYDLGEGMKSVPAKDIISPETLSAPSYAVVYRLDAKQLVLEGEAAFLSYSQNAYVSDRAAYLSRTFESDDGKSERRSMTEICLLSYKDAFEYKGSVTVEGYIKDQYSLDEYKGILRVVTTTSVTKYEAKGENIAVFGNGNTNASLYCIDLSDMSVKASVLSFAPEGETVRSVRFDGDAAYVCTSIQLSDPVFFFDLSDLSNITHTDTGTIDGFSSSLIQMGDGYLLGIGQGNSWSTFKIEMYKETENGVVSVCSYELDNTYYSSDYKSYYVDRENGLIGLGVQTGSATKYIVVFFDGTSLRELVNAPLAGDTAHMRGVYVDGYFYMFGSNDFKVKNIG